MTLGVAAAVCLLGGARDCAGSNHAILSVGNNRTDERSTDAGGDADGGIDAAVDLDAGTLDHSDWVVVPLGTVDNDAPNPLLFDRETGVGRIVSANRATGKIVHFAEASDEWVMTEHGTYGNGDARSITCGNHPTLSIANRNSLFFFEGTDSHPTVCDSVAPFTQIYFGVFGLADSFPTTRVASSLTAVGEPHSVVDSAGSVHLVFTSEGAIQFWTISDFVSAHRQVGDRGVVTRSDVYLGRDDLPHVLYEESGATYRLNLGGDPEANLSEIIDLEAFPSAFAYEPETTRLHLLVMSPREGVLHHIALSDGGERLFDEIVDFASGCNHIALAASPSIALALACGRNGVGVDFYNRLDDGSWIGPSPIRVPDGAPLPSSVYPTLAFDLSNRPHVVFAGQGNNNLYYATPN